MENDKGKTALITGATSGIGFELSRLFARDGYNLVLVARSTDKLNEMADALKSEFSIQVDLIPKDLSIPSSPLEVYKELQDKGISIQVLVNNAGFGTSGAFADTSLSEQLQMIQLNITTLSHLTHLFVNDMVSQGGGKVLNIASTASFQPIPFMNVYSATKSYVLSFSVALRGEMKNKNVTVTALCPGPTATNFSKRANLEGSGLFSRNVMDAKTVAEIGYRAMNKNKAFVISGFLNKLMAFSVRLVPLRAAAKIASSLVSK